MEEQENKTEETAKQVTNQQPLASASHNPHLGVLAVGLTIAFLIVSGMVIFSVSNFSDLQSQYDSVSEELLDTKQELLVAKKEVPPVDEEEPASTDSSAKNEDKKISYDASTQLILNATETLSDSETAYTIAAQLYQEFFIAKSQQEITAFVQWGLTPDNLDKSSNPKILSGLATIPDAEGYVLVDAGDITLTSATDENLYFYQVVVEAEGVKYYGPLESL